MAEGNSRASWGREDEAVPARRLGALALSLPAAAQVQPFPAGFGTQEIQTDGATIHVRVGGEGPAVILLHGYGETGDMWAPLAAELARDHTVVALDLRGLGLSSRPEGGYDKKTRAHDVARVLDALRIERAGLVTHDIGNMVGYAFAAQYPGRLTRFVIMDAPLPGVGPWDEIARSRALWHFSFKGPDASGSSPRASGSTSIGGRRRRSPPCAPSSTGSTGHSGVAILEELARSAPYLASATTFVAGAPVLLDGGAGYPCTVRRTISRLFETARPQPWFYRASWRAGCPSAWEKGHDGERPRQGTSRPRSGDPRHRCGDVGNGLAG